MPEVCVSFFKSIQRSLGRNLGQLLFLILCISLLGGCALGKSLLGFQERENPKPVAAPVLPPKPKPMVTQENNVTLRINAEKKLNLYLANPHSLLLTIFQLENTQTFKQLARTPAGMRKLMTGDKVDNTILSRSHKYLQPGSHFTVNLNRDENAKYVAVIAGYYQLNPRNTVRLAPLPHSVCVRPYENDAYDNIVGGEVSVIVQLGELKIKRFGISDTRECLAEDEVEALGFQQPNFNRNNAYPHPIQPRSNPGKMQRTIDTVNKGVDGAYGLYRKKIMIDQMSSEVDSLF